MTVYSLVLDGERPWTTNQERKWSRWARAEKVAQWRERAAWCAKANGIPHLEAVTVTAWPLVRSRRAWQDVAGCHPAVKAVIDGLVDAHVLDDDTPDIVRAITFTAPVLGELDGLAITLEPIQEGTT